MADQLVWTNSLVNTDWFRLQTGSARSTAFIAAALAIGRPALVESQPVESRPTATLINRALALHH
jgi:hypothetical protein